MSFVSLYVELVDQLVFTHARWWWWENLFGVLKMSAKPGPGGGGGIGEATWLASSTSSLSSSSSPSSTLSSSSKPDLSLCPPYSFLIFRSSAGSRFTIGITLAVAVIPAMMFLMLMLTMMMVMMTTTMMMTMYRLPAEKDGESYQKAVRWNIHCYLWTKTKFGSELCVDS